MPRVPFLLVLLLLPVPAAGSDEKAEKPFYQVENNGTGPLTLAELQISIPRDIDETLSKRQRGCVFQKVETLAADAGDPETLDPAKVAFLPTDGSWSDLTRFHKRLLLAQAVISRAFTLCI